MRRVGFTVLALLFSSAAACAEEAPQSGYDWSGFSAGIFAGYFGASFDQDELFTNAFGGGWWFPPGPNPDYDYNDEGLMAGAQLDWNVQRGNLVAGVGLEVGHMGIDKTVADPNALPIPIPGPSGPITTLDGGMFGSVTGKLGFAVDRLLIFARAGVAVLDLEAHTVDECARSFCNQLSIDAEGHEALFGLTAGAGVEFALNDRISIGAEYRAYQFDDLTVSGFALSSGVITTNRYSQDISPDLIHTGRVSFNFRF